MKNMKEGLQKIKAGLRPEPRAYSLLLAFALVCAVLIQRQFGVQHFVGSFMLAGVLLFVFYRDLKRYKPYFLERYRMLLLLGLLMVGTLAVCRLTEYMLLGLLKGLEMDWGGAVAFGIPVAAGAMLVTLLFDFHTALVFSLIVSLFTGLWQGQAPLAVYAFAGSLTGAFSVIRCTKRTAILRGGLYVIVANMAMAVFIVLFSGQLLSQEAFASVTFAGFSGLLVVAIVSLLLPVLEYLFKITTDISLLELLDLNHPLMKNLMLAAPGTYHHSIVVGNLVDAVAEKIGVNPLLARVGAYYHDIGKVKMPEYFIENQPVGKSKHERLTPHMSTMILTSHVKEGSELARQYKLPQEVMDIIQQHHGSSLITYFFEKAKEQPDGTDFSEQDYRYPGPKPQSRVAALIMMADAVEAASKVLSEPTPSRISALIDKVIDHIYLAGQLEECELTLKDINEIKKSFAYILTGIFHKRVEYPGFDFQGGAKADEGNHSKQAKEDKARPKADKERLVESAQPAGPPKGGT
jgi:putative nucleotidyltransferase with HDIG domain